MGLFYGVLAIVITTEPGIYIPVKSRLCSSKFVARSSKYVAGSPKFVARGPKFVARNTYRSESEIRWKIRLKHGKKTSKYILGPSPSQSRRQVSMFFGRYWQAGNKKNNPSLFFFDGLLHMKNAEYICSNLNIMDNEPKPC